MIYIQLICGILGCFIGDMALGKEWSEIFEKSNIAKNIIIGCIVTIAVELIF